jgi:hypothetical protein
MNNEEFIRVLSESTKIKNSPGHTDFPSESFTCNSPRSEDDDEFIALDFREICAPPFENWITDNRDFRKGKYQKGDIKYEYFDFDWRLVNNGLFATIKVNVLDNHDCVHSVFRSYASDIAPSMSDLELSRICRPCNINIGTFCARTAISTFFTYKNVFVRVRAIPILSASNPLRDILSEWTDEALVPKSPDGRPWDMVIAEWIYGVLKTTSRFKVFPAEPSPR